MGNSRDDSSGDTSDGRHVGDHALFTIHSEDPQIHHVIVYLYKRAAIILHAMGACFINIINGNT